MHRLHHLIVKNWKSVLIVFIVLSALFVYCNNTFKKKLGQLSTEEACAFIRASIECSDVQPQLFTQCVSFKKLDEEKWQNWKKCLTANNNTTLIKLNKWIFILDNIWALFLIGTLYLLGNVKSFKFDSQKKIFLSALLIAYVADFFENGIYLSLSGSGFPRTFLPAIGSVKIIFYGLCVVYLLGIGVRGLVIRFGANGEEGRAF